MSEHGGHDTAAAHDDHGSVNHRRDYFRIFWVLLVLTIVEVGIAYLHLPKKVSATLMIGLALSKATFVALYYMHLKYEKRSLLWLAAVPFPLAAFYAVFLMLDAHEIIRAITLPWR